MRTTACFARVVAADQPQPRRSGRVGFRVGPRRCADRSPGTSVKKMATHARFSVKTGVPGLLPRPAQPGSATATRTPTVCYVSTSPTNGDRALQTSRTSTTSLQNSTAALDKPSDGDHHHKHSTKRCDEPRTRMRIASTEEPMAVGVADAAEGTVQLASGIQYSLNAHVVKGLVCPTGAGLLSAGRSHWEWTPLFQ